ncbi:MAG: cupin domain-containing protein [Minicystis sp.]
MRNILFLTALLATGCAVPSSAEITGESASALTQGQMIVYEAGHAISQDQLVDLGPPEGLGGTVLAGDPHISARVDYADNGLLGGVFQATSGKVLIHFPFTEHATILDGEVALTDEDGNHAVLKPGDSYFIKQGSNIVWEVSGDRVQKSFFNRTEAADAPGPMVIYPKGSTADADDLVDLGPPSALGGTVLDGDPHISARIDYASAGLADGIFQATRGTVLVDFPFTEHATVLRGKFTLVDETGATHEFKPGDSYLIAQGSEIHWDVQVRRTQKSFFNVTQP